MKNSLINQIKTLLGMEVKLEQMKLADGVTVLEAEVFEAGNEIVIVTEDEQKISLPIGEYELEDGRILVVVEEGIISEVKEVSEEEEMPEVPAEEVPTEAKEEVKAETATPKKTVESVVKETFFAEIEKLKEENKTLKGVQLSGDLNVSAFLELPIGEHKIGNDTITVSEREMDGYDGTKYMQKYIVSIIPNKQENLSSIESDKQSKPISFNPENVNPIEKVKIASKRERSIMDSIMEKLNK